MDNYPSEYINSKTLSFFGILAVALGTLTAIVASSQVQPEQPALPRTWIASEMSNTTDLYGAQVTVVETSGACIYVFRSFRGSDNDGARDYMHVVLKKDIGAGRGC